MEGLTETKAILKSLIISHGRGLSLKDLEDDYKTFTGNNLPYLRLGFRSLEKFLESLSDTVRLERHSYGITVHSTFSKNSEHIAQMKSSEKNRRKQHKNFSSNPRFQASSRKFHDQKSIPVNSKYKYPGNIVAPHNSIHIKNVPAHNPVSTQFHHYIHYMPENKSVNQKEFEKNTQNPSTLQQNSIHFKHNYQNKENIDSAEKIKNSNPNSANNLQHKTTEIEDKCPHSLSISFKELNLNQLESKEQTRPINQTVNLNIPSASSFAPETKHLNKTTDSVTSKIRIQHDKKLKQYYNNLNVIHEKTSESTSNKNVSALPPLRHDDEIFLIDYPLPYSDICNSIPKTILPDEFREGRQVIKLFITEVHNPFRFWFNIATNPIEHPLDVLMSDIEDFYKSLQPNELTMSKSHIYPGQACVTLYRNIWHRAEILDVALNHQTNDSYVKVFYADYGTVSKCKIGNLKYMLKKFGILPRQAYRGTLSDIRPYIKWNRDAIKFFIQSVTDAPLRGKITYLEEDRNICHLRLLRYYSPEEQLVYKVKQRLINELLLEVDGLAKHSPHYLKPNTEISIRERHYYHEQQKFPSFELLELGKYPSYGQILHKFQTEGLDLEEKTFWLMQLEDVNVPVRYD